MYQVQDDILSKSVLIQNLVVSNCVTDTLILNLS